MGLNGGRRKRTGNIRVFGFLVGLCISMWRGGGCIVYFRGLIGRGEGREAKRMERYKYVCCMHPAYFLISACSGRESTHE